MLKVIGNLVQLRFLFTFILAATSTFPLFSMEKVFNTFNTKEEDRQQTSQVYGETEEEYIEKIESYYKNLPSDTLLQRFSMSFFSITEKLLVSAITYKMAEAYLKATFEPVTPLLNKFGDCTALMLACLIGDRTLVTLFLSAKADVNGANKLGWTALMLAARKGNVELVKQLLNAGANSNVQVPHSGWTALNLAIKNGHKDVVALLLDKGADVSLRSLDRKSALNLAAQYGYKDIVEMLLERKVLLETKDGEEATPLLRAIEKGHKEIVSLLLNHGANVDATCLIKQRGSNTALILAARAGNEHIVDLLLKRGVFVNECNSQGQTPATFAGLTGNETILQRLLDVGSSTQDIKTQALLGAAFKGHRGMVSRLLKQGVSANIKASVNIKAMNEDPLDEALLSCLEEYRGHESALTLAVQGGHKDIVILLLEAGADVNYKNEHGITPLLIAIKKGDRDLVKLLLGRGASLNIEADVTTKKDNRDFFDEMFDDADLIPSDRAKRRNKDLPEALKEQKNAIMLAVQSGHKDIVILLLDAGADVNYKNERGVTPLLVAIERGDRDLVKLLLDRGASVSICDNKKATAFIYAGRAGHIEVLQDLLMWCGDKGTAKVEALFGAIYAHDTYLINTLLSMKTDVTAKNQTGFTTLHTSVETRLAKETVALLIDAGADVNAQDDNGWTPLMYAASGCYQELVSLLVNRGADCSIKNSKGDTALIVALKGWKRLDQCNKHENPTETVRILLERETDNHILEKHRGCILNRNRNHGHQLLSLFIAKGMILTPLPTEQWPPVQLYQSHFTEGEYYETRGGDSITMDALWAKLLSLLVQEPEVKKYLSDACSVNNEMLKGLDLIYRSPRGHTLLMVACMLGHTEVIKGLKDHVSKEYLNIVDDYDYCALDHAFKFGKTDAAIALIETYGNYLDYLKQDSNLFEIAIDLDSLKLVNVLLKAGLRPTVKDLEYSAATGRLFIMFKLLIAISNNDPYFIAHPYIRRCFKNIQPF